MRNSSVFFSICAFIYVFCGCSEQKTVPEVKLEIDWENFMAQHDLIWEELPSAWYEGSFMGNGLIGTIIYKEPGKNALRFEVCRSDVQDHRDSTFGDTPFSRPRLPIGHFTLEPVGTIADGSNMRLDLWNAETRGQIKTDKGIIDFSAIVHSEELGIIVHINPDEGEKGFKWKWHGAEAISPRQKWGIEKKQDYRVFKNYKHNPPFELKRHGDVNLCVQPLLVGGQTVTAWKEQVNGNSRSLVISVEHSWPDNSAENNAKITLEKLINADPSKLLSDHRFWWHSYYPLSFISLPDGLMESFYWIQIYKLASATRADRAYIDNHGPWLEATAWPYATWNLNVQLSYWPVYTSNRLSLGESLLNSLVNNRQNLINNIPEPYRHNSSGIGRAACTNCIAPVGIPGQLNYGVPEVGLLTWACHNLWLQYRYSMDSEMLRNDIFPLLKRSVNYYLHFLKEGEDGKYHLPITYSPEFGVSADCNFDLALIRWGCQALLQSCEKLNINDPLIPKWEEVLAGLTGYPEDENGFMVGADRPFDYSHRHYSHLLMIYPLYLVNIDQPGDSQLISTSLKHWQGLSELLMGYSFTGASSISSALGNGNEAWEYLKGLMKFLKPNTMYAESGPVIETPLSAAQSIHDMLIQSWGDKIRIFPAVPDDWQELVFHDLRTEGAFLISAARKEGKTRYVRIKSLAGEPLRIIPGLEGRVKVSGYREFKFQSLADGVYSIDLNKGEEAVLFSGDLPSLIMNPIKNDENEHNGYGLPYHFSNDREKIEKAWGKIEGNQTP